MSARTAALLGHDGYAVDCPNSTVSEFARWPDAIEYAERESAWSLVPVVVRNRGGHPIAAFLGGEEIGGMA